MLTIAFVSYFNVGEAAHSHDPKYRIDKVRTILKLFQLNTQVILLNSHPAFLTSVPSSSQFKIQLKTHIFIWSSLNDL